VAAHPMSFKNVKNIDFPCPRLAMKMKERRRGEEEEDHFNLQ